MQNDDKDQPKPLTTETVVGALALFLMFASAPSRLLMVKPGTMGRRAMGGIELLGAGLFLPVFASFLGNEKGMPLVIPFSGFLCVWWCVQKVKSYASHEIEEYIGTTWMSTWFPRSENVQVIGEWVVWGLVAVPCWQLCPAVFLGLVASGVASMFYVGFVLEREKREIQMMINERRKQEIQAERFRRMSGE